MTGNLISANGAPRRRKRVWPRVLLVAAILLVLVIGGLVWYASTPKFEAMVDRKVVTVLEDTVGGTVVIRDIRWNIWHLTVYADDVTIHGLESASEIPYFHADHIQIGVRILSFLSPRVSLSMLRVEQPVAHVIVYKDGTTNQPTPRNVIKQSKSTVDTVFDLQAQQVELVNGVALLNQRAIPFNLAARDMNARVTYKAAPMLNAKGDHYEIALAVSDLTTKMMTAPAVHSRMNLNIELGRDQADLKQLTWDTGLQSDSAVRSPGSSRMQASGILKRFSDPQWSGAATGTLDLRQFSDLVAFDGFSQGIADLGLKGHSCTAQEIATAQSAAKKPIGARDPRKPSVDELCGEAWVIEGNATLRGAAYKNPFVNLAGVEIKTQARMTPTFLILTEATGSIVGGGSATGELHMVNWQYATPPQVPPLTAPLKKGVEMKAAAATPTMHAVLEAQVNRLPLRTVLQATSPKQFQEIGFDTAGSGKVHVEWGVTPESVYANAQLHLTPTGATPRGASSPGVPITGTLDAAYEGPGETVRVKTLTAKTVASSVDASGVVGVFNGDGKTDLRVDLLTSDLGEFDQLLKVLEWETNGHKGASSIPVELHGTAQFHGTAVGGLHTLDIKGHLEAQQFDAVLDTILPPATIVVPPAATKPLAAAANAAGTVQTATAKVAAFMQKLATPAPAAQKTAAKKAQTAAAVAKTPTPAVAGSAPAPAPPSRVVSQLKLAAPARGAPPLEPTAPPASQLQVPAAAVAPGSPTPAVAGTVSTTGPNATPVPGPAASDLAGTPRRLRLDSIVADAEYTPGLVTVTTAVIQRAGATITISGTATPPRLLSKNPFIEYVWDNRTVINGTLQLNHAVMGDLLHLAGLDVPISGTLDAKAHLAGPMAKIAGDGQLTLRGGSAYGEPYQTLTADLALNGGDLQASKFALTLPAGQIVGNGAYNVDTKAVRAHLTGKIDIPKLQAMKSSQVQVAGQLTLSADANGTTTEPNLKASVQLAGLTLGGEPMGSLSADLHSQGSTLFFTSKSELINAKFDADGQTQLTGDYMTQAKLVFTGVDIDSLLRLYAPQGITGHSAIGGTVTLSGPLKLPRQLNGTADLNQFNVKISGIELKGAEPLRMSVQNGILKIDQFHIVGPDTDLKASGTADLLNTAGGGGLNLHTEGSINMALAQTLDTDLTSSGKVKFAVDVLGTTHVPDLRGTVQFSNVNLGLQDLANGLSQVNGTLTFDQNRLQVENLTGMTGGGQLQLGGYIGFNHGLYADLTAKGENVRLRYPPGVSSTANADLRLQGTQGSSVLSGTILLTRFELGQSFDAASLASSTGGLSAPPDPNAPTSHIVLDVHITSAPQLDFQNSYAKLAGDVDLRIRGTVADPSVLGKITITDGSATFAGTKYQLQRGDIYFTNPVRIEPIIDLDATARVRDYDLTIGLHGPASNLQPTYRSEPPLSEADIFGLLALGRTQEQAQIYQQQQAAAGQNSTTDALLYGALNATVSNRVSKLFGVGSVKVDPSFVGTLGNSAARITVEQSVGNNVTLTYATNVNATAEQLIQVQWELTRNVSLVAVRDETGVFSLIFKVRRLYH